MKKNVLSLSIAAVIGSLGFSGAALAGIAYPMGLSGTSGVVDTFPRTTATSLVVNPNGIGHNLLVPYYTVQEGNATLLSIVNTDPKNGKAVKVRFRGASNSDDVFSFTLFLSPSDVWVAHVSKDATSGRAQIYTPDNTCTLPLRATLNGTKFVTDRVYGADDAAKAGETLEGYVEIINMADIPPKLPAKNSGEITAVGVDKLIDNPLFTAIKHTSAGTNPCGLAANAAALPQALTNLGTDPALSAITAATADASADGALVLQRGLWAPSTGLTGSWTILNITGASVAWSGNMTAIEARKDSAAASGRVVFSPQTSNAESSGNINSLTADPLLIPAGTPARGAVDTSKSNLPDLSTPYLLGDAGATPTAQAKELARALAVQNVVNEYVTNPQISAATDWVFSMPARRYAVGVDYSKLKGTGALLTTASGDYFATENTSIPAGAYQACVDPGTGVTAFDQEEGQASGEFVVSPGTIKKLTFCGATSVLTFNQTSALKAKLATKDIDAGFVNGWLNVNTNGLSTRGLPIVGSSFVKITGPLVAGKSTSFSITQPHRFTTK